MRSTLVRAVFWSFVVTLVASTQGQSSEAASCVGRSVEDFTLRSHRGTEWSLQDVDGNKLVVIAFLGTECPLAKLYAPRLTQLEKRFGKQGVAFVAINSNTQDSVTEMTAYAARHGLSFPLLKDVGNRVADAMGAERTPEVFVLDEQRVVRYHGRIDDQYGVGYARDRAERHDLSEALTELLEDKPVSVAETVAPGCYIGRVKEVEPRGEITYASHIASILNNRCVECHRDGQIAPFTLTSYDDVVGWEDTILEVISDNRMPPWFANPKHGEFLNDARLSENEKQLIATWVENGMPAGDLNQAPPAPQFAQGWRIPEPDQVIYMRDKHFDVPAEGVVDYQYFEVDPGWTEDKYIYAAEARPENTSVVHHIIVYVDAQMKGLPVRRQVMLTGYAPGSDPKILRDGVAIYVPAGGKLRFELHYTPNGSPQRDRSYVGFCFMDKKDVKKRLRGRMAINTKFEIPAHADNHRVTATYKSRRDEVLLSMTPHMHVRGKSFRYEAIYPNGDRETLLDVPRYDFNWQLSYDLAEPKFLPKGTKIFCTGHFDNSEDNLVNPDPTEPVRWGEQSWEEMMIGFFDVVSPDKDSKRSTVQVSQAELDRSRK